MTERELRTFEARRAFRDIFVWGTKLSGKIQESFTFTSVEMQVLKIECEAFRENLDEIQTKYPDFIREEMAKKIAIFNLILDNMDWSIG